MNSSAKAAPTTTGTTTTAVAPASIPATSERDGIPRPHPTTKDAVMPATTSTNRDSYLNTFFNPVWTSGPYAFTFDKEGRIVRPETYTPEPYPGYHRDRAQRLHFESVQASRSQGLSRREEKPWKNVAITEQDDAEFAAIQARAWARANAVGEWENQMYYGHLNAQRGMYEQGVPEFVHTWPPPPPQRR